jgi:hypothetical protein
MILPGCKKSDASWKLPDADLEWLQLQKAFEWQLQQTEELFSKQRRNALAELQARLHRLVE